MRTAIEQDCPSCAHAALEPQDPFHELFKRAMREGFAAPLQNLFRAVRDLPSTHPVVEELKQFGAALDRHLAEIETTEKHFLPTLLERLQRTDPREMRRGFKQLINRLRNETDYLHELEDTNIAQALENGWEEVKFGARVYFVSDQSGAGRRMHREGVRGAYDPELDYCVIRGRRPELVEIWESLVQCGRMPAVISILDHELTHDAQYRKGQRVAMWGTRITHFAAVNALISKFGFPTGVGLALGTLPIIKLAAGMFRNDQVLSEVHAYEAAASAASFEALGVEGVEHILMQVLSGYSHGSPTDVRKAVEAFRLTRGLRLLGLDDREIGVLVSGARFDHRSGTFTVLRQRFDAELAKLGLIDPEQIGILMSGLAAKHSITVALERKRAREIAIEELGKLGG